MSETVYTLTLNGPGKNALGSDLLTRFRASLQEAGGRPLLLTGSDGCFSAGLHLKEVATLDAPAMGAFLGLLEDAVTELLHYPGPTVAAVNGHAIAGGAVLARCCDLAVCTPNPRVRIGLNEVANGLRFPPRTLQALLTRIPRQHHFEVLLGAQLHSPQDAARLGLVDLLDDDVLGVAQARLAVLASHPADAYAATKADLLVGATDITEEARASFARDVVRTWTSDAIRQRLAAVLGR